MKIHAHDLILGKTNQPSLSWGKSVFYAEWTNFSFGETRSFHKILLHITCKAGHRSNLASLRFRVNAATERRKHTQVDLLWITRRFRTIAVFPISLDAGIFTSTLPATKRKSRTCATRATDASIVLEDVDTHRSNFRRRVNAQTKCRQSHVNAGTVSEIENAGT